MVEERRTQRRVRVVWKATLTRLNGEQLLGSTDNVSIDGANVIVAKSLVLGEPVRLEIVTPCRNGTCFFRLDTVVVYDRALDDNLGHAIGLRLLQQEAGYRQAIESLDSDPRFQIA